MPIGALLTNDGDFVCRFRIELTDGDGCAQFFMVQWLTVVISGG